MLTCDSEKDAASASAARWSGLMQMHRVTDREAISRAIPDQQPKGLVLQSGKVTPLNDTFYSGELRRCHVETPLDGSIHL